MASRQDGASSSSRKLAGRTIGGFAIDKEIGKGSFAQVYMGWHKVRCATPSALHVFAGISSSTRCMVTSITVPLAHASAWPRFTDCLVVQLG